MFLLGHEIERLYVPFCAVWTWPDMGHKKKTYHVGMLGYQTLRFTSWHLTCVGPEDLKRKPDITYHACACLQEVPCAGVKSHNDALRESAIIQSTAKYV